MRHATGQWASLSAVEHQDALMYASVHAVHGAVSVYSGFVWISNFGSASQRKSNTHRCSLSLLINRYLLLVLLLVLLLRSRPVRN